VEPTDLAFRTASNNHRDKIGGIAPDIVLMHKEDRRIVLELSPTRREEDQGATTHHKGKGGNPDKVEEAS